MAVDASDPSISIPVGITIGLIASFIQSLGLTIQRKSHVLNQALPEDQQKVEHHRPLWVLGFAIFISSNLFGSLFQIASLPVVILAPLGAVSLLWNAFFARLLLGDVFSPWMVLGTLLIAGGAVLIAVFGIVSEPTHSLEDLLKLFSRPAFIAYFSLLGFVVLAWLVVTHLIEYSYTGRFKPADVSPPLSPLVFPTSAPSILTSAANHAVDPTSPTERTPLIDRKPQPRSKSPSSSASAHSMITSPLSYTARSPRTPIFLASSYASISGILSGMCLLFAKSGVELLLLTFSGHNQFWRWQAWVLVLSLVIFALLQLWYMHKGLVLADPTLVCPLAFCFYNLSSIVNGLVYFDQFSMLSTTHLLLVLLGIAILLGGVWVVSFPPEGGRGVDIGTWSEGEPPTELLVTGEGSDTDGEVEFYEDEPLPMEGHAAESRRGRSQSQIGLGLSIITEPPTRISPPQLSPKPPSPSQLRSHLSSAHSRHQTDSTLLTSPPRRSRSTYTGSTGPEYAATSEASGALSGRRRRRTILEPGSAFSRHPLSPPGSGMGGFSIGLSPISPGFSIVPRERRRHQAGTGSGASTSASASGGDTAARGSDTASAARLPSIRRVVSEGDADVRERRRRPEAAPETGESQLPYGTDSGMGTGTASASTTTGADPEAQQQVQGTGRRVKERWKWVQSLLLRGS